MNQTDQHPLLEPNILRCLGKHLPRSQLPTCLRVCKKWHSTLEPFLWETLTLLNQPVNFTPRQATPTLLLRNRHHIRHLHEIGTNSLIHFLAYSITPRPVQLTSIHCSILSPEILVITQQNVDTLTSFICRSNRLRKDQEAQGLWCRQLFFILEMAPNLTEFALGPVIMLDPPNQEFNKISKNLKRLELDRVKVSVPTLYADSVPQESIVMDTFHSLESLTLVWNDFPPPCQIELIRKSPNLKALVWRRGTKLLAESWLSGSLAVPSRLSSLDIGNSHLDDQDMARLLSLIHNLVALNARSTPFSTHSLALLMNNQGPNMLELELMDCDGLNSDQVFTILTSMPKLKKFSASMLSASDFDSIATSGGDTEATATATAATTSSITARPPWVCLGLEELEISILGPSTCEDTDHARYASSIYKQLGKLTQLRTLVLKEIILDGQERGPLLDLTLEMGLAHLACLKQLRELHTRGLSVKMGTTELEWIAKEWTRLEVIKGPLNCVTGVDNKPLIRKLKELSPVAVVL
ncbi:hypothetical protein BGZ80_006529 [Entomortierella chlamydospora]|uniref:F-box domain-containing protein n=1 Tax=Entomortierella chlamydospora TaxID=101097 RepID=A0A9P6MHA9_9FUNG|nr:hypothetical protein BGZ79_000201 [Entomortierella chlamydospora]KAF9999613.1 hypothetical protein BGZ80_006529 [Entomortierella chlamydospora]